MFSPDIIKKNMIVSEHFAQGLKGLKDMKDMFVYEIESHADKQIEFIRNQDISKSVDDKLNRAQKRKKLNDLEEGRAEAIKQTRNWRNKTISKWDKGIANVLDAVEKINAFLETNRSEHMDFDTAHQSIHQNSEAISSMISDTYDLIEKQKLDEEE